MSSLSCNLSERRRTTLYRRHNSAQRPVDLTSTHPPPHHHHQCGARGGQRAYSVSGAVGCHLGLHVGLVSVVEAARHNAHQLTTSGHQLDNHCDYVRVRSFSTSSRGVKNRGDSLKRRQQQSTTSSDECRVVSTDETAASRLRVVVVGDVGVGKRSIMSQFSSSDYMHGVTDYSPTALGKIITAIPTAA